jgi:putative oxidoreductase
MADSSAPAVSRPLVALRIAVAVLLGIHGYFRALTGGPVGFGEYLSGVGFPFGLALAWAITIFEMVGSLCLLTGRLVRVVCVGFAANLIAGIVLVHGREGWFVVGGGRNGVEYSVLLICCLGVLFASYSPAAGAAREGR